MLSAGTDHILRGVFTNDEVVAALEAARNDLASAREKATVSKNKVMMTAAKFRKVGPRVGITAAGQLRLFHFACD